LIEGLRRRFEVDVDTARHLEEVDETLAGEIPLALAEHGRERDVVGVLSGLDG